MMAATATNPETGELWDAIVVGAGPAGCAAAYDLAALGRRVLLLDRAAFPRPKACAGGLTMKAVRALRYPIDPVVRRWVNSIDLEGPGGLPDQNRERRTVGRRSRF
jgi:flavin-dependent dehydrogenase